MHYMFGREETLTCIVDVPLKDSKDLPLCLGYKTTRVSVFVPIYLKDDGYVLSPKNSLSQYYPLPRGAELASLQASGALPSPLPAYHISAVEYALGYSFWLAVAFGIASLILERAIKRRRQRSLHTDLLPSTSPPELRTKTDRWLAAEATKLLKEGEAVQHQAYGTNQELNGTLSAVSVRALYAVLTNQRLLLIQARLGAFGPLRENRSVTEFARASIRLVAQDERHLRFHFEDGSHTDFFAEWSERHLSNQKRFLSDVPRLLGEQRPLETEGFAPG